MKEHLPIDESYPALEMVQDVIGETRERFGKSDIVHTFLLVNLKFQMVGEIK